jgi:hypothetical protein
MVAPDPVPCAPIALFPIVETLGNATPRLGAIALARALPIGGIKKIPL